MVQTKRLDISYTIDFNQLPVSSDSVPETHVNQIIEYGALNQAFNQLTNLIRETGGHRFWVMSIRKNPEITYYYSCFQVIEFAPNAIETTKRDRSQIDRLACEGQLKIYFNLQNRQSKVILSHSYHKRYTDVQLGPAVMAFISTRCSSKTHMEIYYELLKSRISDAEKVTQRQVSYQWHQANIFTWKRDAGPFFFCD